MDFSAGNTLISITAHHTAVNAGSMVIAGYGNQANVVLNADNAGYTNTGTMHVETSGSLDLIWGGDNMLIFSNDGTLEASDGGTLTLEAPHATSSGSGSVHSSSLIDANGGTVKIDAPLDQDDLAITYVENNGTLDLNSIATGGTIQITSGMLNFGPASGNGDGPDASKFFASHIVLDGMTAAIGFGGVPILEVFNEGPRNLL